MRCVLYFIYFLTSITVYFAPAGLFTPGPKVSNKENGVLVKIWSSCIFALMEIHFVWIEKIWFHLPVISNKENWSDWANMKQVHAKAQSRKFEKRNKKVFSLVIISSSGSSSRMEYPKYFPGIFVYFWCPAVFCFPVTELRALASLGGYEGVR